MAARILSWTGPCLYCKGWTLSPFIDSLERYVIVRKHRSGPLCIIFDLRGLSLTKQGNKKIKEKMIPSFGTFVINEHDSVNRPQNLSGETVFLTSIQHLQKAALFSPVTTAATRAIMETMICFPALIPLTSWSLGRRYHSCCQFPLQLSRPQSRKVSQHKQGRRCQERPQPCGSASLRPDGQQQGWEVWKKLLN